MIHRSVLFLLSDRRGMGASAAKLSPPSLFAFVRVDKNFPPSAGFLHTHSPLTQIPAFHAYLCSPSPGGNGIRTSHHPARGERNLIFQIGAWRRCLRSAPSPDGPKLWL